LIAPVHQTRTVLILSSIAVACVIALYLGSHWLQRELTDKPYVANVTTQLRLLAAAEASYRRDSLAYTSEIARVWQPTAETQGVQLHILTASADGFLAQGNHDSWTGWCVIGAGTMLGDSLKAGDAVCHWKAR
jgi:hypothetical protein